MRLVAAAALAIGLALPAAAQEEDQAFLAQLLSDALSDAGRDVQIFGFEGALSSRATIREMTVSDGEGVWLTMRDLVLDWNRSALFRRALEVEEFTAGEIIIERAPQAEEEGPSLPATEARPFALPELPLSVQIGTVAIDRMVLGEALLGEPAEARLEGTAELAGGEGSARLTVVRTDGEEGALNLEGAFSNESRILALDATLTEAENGIAANLLNIPGRPSIDLSIAGEGPLDDFAAEVRLATAGQERLAGEVALMAEGDEPEEATQRFRADIAGDIAPLFAPEFADFFGDRIALVAEGARAPDGALELSQLDLQASAIELSGSMLIGGDGLPQLVRLEGEVADPEGGAVILPIAGPRTSIARAGILLDYDAARGDEWQAEFEILGLARPDISIERLGLAGSGQIAQDPEGARANADFRFEAEGVQPRDEDLAMAVGDSVRGELLVNWQEGRPVDIPVLRLRGAGYGLEGAGTVRGQTVRGAVEARLESAGRLSGLAGRDLGGAVRGRVEGEYELLSGAFDMAAELAATDLAVGQEEIDSLLAGDSRIGLEARRDESGTQIDLLQVNAQELVAELSGQLSSEGSLVVADLSFRDLSVLGDDFGGSLAAEGRFEDRDGIQRFVFSATGNDLQVGPPELVQLLRGESRLSLEATRRDDEIILDRLSAVAQTLDAEVSGRIVPGASDLRARLDFSDLSAMGNGYGGALQGEGRLFEANGTQFVTFTATGQDLSVGQPEVDNLLRGQSTITLEAAREGEVIRVNRADVDAGTLSAQVSGSIQEGATALDATATLADLSVLGPRFGGSAEAEAALREDGDIRRLSVSAAVSNLALGVPALDPLLRGRSTISVAARQEGETVVLESLQLEGPQLTAAATAASEDGRVLEVSARLADLGLVVPQLPGPVTAGGQVGQEAGGALRLDLSASGPGGIGADITGTVSQDLIADLGISGSADLALVNAFIEPNNIQGPVTFDLRLGGPLGIESLSGTASASGVQVVAPRQGVTLENVSASASISGGQAQVEVQGGVSGGGRVGLSGTIGLEPGLFPADLAVTLEDAHFSDRRIFETRVSGALAITGGLVRRQGRIAGNLTLDGTEIRIPSTGLGASGYIPSIAHVNEPPEVRATRLAARLDHNDVDGNGRQRNSFELDVTVSSPNRVFVRGRGLDAELGGTLRLTGNTLDVVPSGEFTLLRGRLDILGRRFILSDGVARLQGQFVPFIRLTATTTTDGITASITLEGEADALDIRFSSTPELPEEEVVARLLFGRGLDRLSPLQAAQLASAVATLAGRGGEGIVGNLRQTFGLDDFDISTTEDGTAAVRLGRYLTENVYTDVTVDAEGRSEVSINLDVSPSVTVRGRSDSEGRTGIGIFFERDY